MKVSTFLIATGTVYVAAIVLAMFGSAYGRVVLMFIPVLLVVALVIALISHFVGKRS